MRLKGKVAIITGAATGLGLATAIRLAGEGADIVVTDKDERAIPAAVERIQASGGHCVGLALDVTRQADAGAVMRHVSERHGRIDILVNNAGIARHRPFATMGDEDWDLVLAVNLKGAFFCAQAAAPYMTQRRYGKIVNISSAGGTGTTPHNTAGSPAGSSPYAASKAGLIMLTKTLARELGPHGINVNCIAAGSFLTPGAATSRTPEEAAEHAAFRSGIAVLGRQGKPEELADAVLFLASDESSFVAGHTLYVDGGRFDRM